MKSKKLSEKIISLIEKEGFKNIKLESVLETKYILRSSGESFRKLLFSFYDENGKEFSLRPDLSLVSLIQFIQKKNNLKKKICYSGQAYRKTYSRNKSIIKNQIGFEILNSSSKTLDDKEVINNSIKIYKSISNKKAILTIGNIEIFNKLLNKLDIPDRWKKRLSRHFWRRKYFEEILKRLETNSDLNEKVIEIDKKIFKKMKKLNQNLLIGGRSIKEILQRFKMKIKDPRTSKGKKNVKIIKEFLKIKSPISEADKILNNFFYKYNINLKINKKYFPLYKSKIRNLKIEFSTSNIPEVDFYNGLIFSIKFNSARNSKLFISGGRYDKLSTNLGLKKTSAVGAAVNLT